MVETWLVWGIHRELNLVFGDHYLEIKDAEKFVEDLKSGKKYVKYKGVAIPIEECEIDIVRSCLDGR